MIVGGDPPFAVYLDRGGRDAAGVDPVAHGAFGDAVRGGDVGDADGGGGIGWDDPVPRLGQERLSTANGTTGAERANGSRVEIVERGILFYRECVFEGFRVIKLPAAPLVCDRRDGERIARALVSEAATENAAANEHQRGEPGEDAAFIFHHP